jgi:arachidonate 5-lipoxygenase
MECFAVAAWRDLPSIHPVFKLLFPHIRSVMAINTLGRKELISKGGISDVTLSIGEGGHIEVIQKFYKKFTWDMVDIPKDLEKRGLNDREKLPNFHYRYTYMSNIIYVHTTYYIEHFKTKTILKQKETYIVQDYS